MRLSWPYHDHVDETKSIDERAFSGVQYGTTTEILLEPGSDFNDICSMMIPLNLD